MLMYYTISYNLFPITITRASYPYTKNSTDYFKYHLFIIYIVFILIQKYYFNIILIYKVKWKVV